MARLLGIDYGKKRIGLALSDPTGTICSPLDTLENKSMEKAARQIAQLAKEKQVDEFVLGLPLNMDGSEGPSAQAAKHLGKLLNKLSNLTVHMWDERLSTVEAERAMLEADMSRKKRARRIDKVAACMILKSFLDCRQDKNQSEDTL